MKSSTNAAVRNILTLIIIAVVIVVAVLVVPEVIAQAKDLAPNCSGIVC